MKRKKNKKKSVNNYSQSILNILKSDRKKTFNHKQIASKLKVNDASSQVGIIVFHQHEFHWLLRARPYCLISF
jgi:ribonuclease R/exosome complex exonuclease DIS3/RRP44